MRYELRNHQLLTVTVLGLLQPVPLLHLFHDLAARHARVRRRPQRGNLPHQHAVRPDVSLSA